MADSAVAGTWTVAVRAKPPTVMVTRVSPTVKGEISAVGAGSVVLATAIVRRGVERRLLAASAPIGCTDATATVTATRRARLMPPVFDVWSQGAVSAVCSSG